MPYVSVANLKSALGITDATDDVQLSSRQRSARRRRSTPTSAASRRGYVGFAAASQRPASPPAVNTRTYSGTGDDTLFIDDASTHRDP